MSLSIRRLVPNDFDAVIALRSSVFEQGEAMNSHLGVTAADNAEMSKTTLPPILEQGLSAGCFDGAELIGIVLVKTFSLLDEQNSQDLIKQLPKSFEPILLAIQKLHIEYKHNLEVRAQTEPRAQAILNSLTSTDDTVPVSFSTAAVKKGYEGRGIAYALSYACVGLTISTRPNTTCILSECTGERSQAIPKKEFWLQGAVVEYALVDPRFQGMPNHRDGSPARVILFESAIKYATLRVWALWMSNIVRGQSGCVLGIPFEQYDEFMSVFSVKSLASSAYKYVRSMLF